MALHACHHFDPKCRYRTIFVTSGANTVAMRRQAHDYCEQHFVQFNPKQRLPQVEQAGYTFFFQSIAALWLFFYRSQEPSLDEH